MKFELSIPDERVEEFAAIMRNTFGIDCLACSGEEQKAVIVEMITTRVEENQAWPHRECVILTPEDEKMLKDGKTPLDVLRSHIAAYLSTKRGWQENCSACCDFNWGDFACADLEALGVYHDDNVPGALLAADVWVSPHTVYHDELLAPGEPVPAEGVLYQEENEYFRAEVTVDFREGYVTWPDETIGMDFGAATRGEVVVNGETIPLDRQEEFAKLVTDWSLL